MAKYKCKVCGYIHEGNKAPDVALLDVDKARNLSEKDLVADIQPYVDADSNFDKDDYLQVFWNQGYDTN